MLWKSKDFNTVYTNHREATRIEVDIKPQIAGKEERYTIHVEETGIVNSLLYVIYTTVFTFESNAVNDKRDKWANGLLQLLLQHSHALPGASTHFIVG